MEERPRCRHIHYSFNAQYVKALAAGPQCIFAGSASGIYRYADTAGSWSPLGTGMSELNIRSLAVMGADVYAGTDEGLFRFQGALQGK